MLVLSKQSVPNLLVQNLPRDLVFGLEDACLSGAERAHSWARNMELGHRPTALGQARHLYMSETFHQALLAADANPTELRGNRIVTGAAGMFTIGRFNAKHGDWKGGFRSSTRRQMALANKALESLVQPDMFSRQTQVTQGVVFIVACFSGSLARQPERPEAIYVAVPDSLMSGWIFREPIEVFQQRYEATASTEQVDLAVPRLKAAVRRIANDGGKE
jgi:hypothetical protein